MALTIIPVEDREPPRHDDDPEHPMQVEWSACSDRAQHDAHWQSTHQRYQVITNCTGRDSNGDPLPPAF